MKITFNKEESDERTNLGWQWFYGTVNTEGNEFPFTLCEMNTNCGGQNTTATEITWLEVAPDKSEEIEKQLLQKFESDFI